MENFITRFAAYYTPAVVGAAVVLALLPPLLIGSGIIGGAAGFSGALFSKWVYRALEFLVVSCPCALVISVPAQLLRRYRRRLQDRAFGQGQQLSGGSSLRGMWSWIRPEH